MRSIWPADRGRLARRGVLGLLAVSAGAFAAAQAALRNVTPQRNIDGAAFMAHDAMLTASQLAIGPVAAAAAVGDMTGLAAALNRALDAGLTIAEAREVLVQLYAYAGFPRSLNALTALMQVLDERRKRGCTDEPGQAPGPLPAPGDMLDSGTANQTKLSGAAVTRPLFEFAPAIDQYLKAHLFGDIFSRDNLDWQSRELATVAVLAALTGVEPQLLSHIRISMNVGLTADQLKAFAAELSACAENEAGRRASAAVDKHLQTARR